VNLPDEVMNLWIFSIRLTLSGCWPHTSSIWPWLGAPKVRLYNTFLGGLRQTCNFLWNQNSMIQNVWFQNEASHNQILLIKYLMKLPYICVWQSNNYFWKPKISTINCKFYLKQSLDAKPHRKHVKSWILTIWSAYCSLQWCDRTAARWPLSLAYHVIFMCLVTRIVRKSSSCFINGIADINR
jgi:hypothetical protein